MGYISTRKLPKIKFADVLAVLGLLISLWIYHDYRSPMTGINKLLKALGHDPPFFYPYLSIPSWVIYSLPEGLWVMAVTIWSRGLRMSIVGLNFSAFAFPILFAFGLELLQLCKVTDGYFDWNDLWVSLSFWLLGLWFTRHREYPNENALLKYSIIASCYLIVFLSDLFF